jgi:hypothetical protein
MVSTDVAAQYGHVIPDRSSTDVAAPFSRGTPGMAASGVPPRRDAPSPQQPLIRRSSSCD